MKFYNIITYMVAQNEQNIVIKLLSALSTVPDKPPPLQVLQLIPVLGISLITGRRNEGRRGGCFISGSTSWESPSKPLT